jgi:hypothetical protein
LQKIAESLVEFVFLAPEEEEAKLLAATIAQLGHVFLEAVDGARTWRIDVTGAESTPNSGDKTSVSSIQGRRRGWMISAMEWRFRLIIVNQNPPLARTESEY